MVSHKSKNSQSANNKGFTMLNLQTPVLPNEAWFFCFALAEFFSHTRQEPVRRLDHNLVCYGAFK